MGSEAATILVAEDDSFVRDLLRETLEAGGYAPRIFENGRDALDHFLGSPQIDLILSDMNMPVMGGLELLKRVRESGSDVPIVFLTSESEISVALEAIRAGANDYLLKDEHILDTILLAVEKAMEKHRLKKQNLRLMEDLARKNGELERSNEELVGLNKLKNRFLGMAAHDLRNPLSAIKGYCEALLEEGDIPGDERKEYLEGIQGAAVHMLDLVNDLLDVTIIESGRIEIQPQTVSLARILEERIRLNRVLAEKKGISIETSLDEAREARVDANRIVQVFDNLMSNAVKFSPHGSRIAVSLATQGGWVRVAVKDQGPGISEEDRCKLFGEFQKLSARPTGGEKSTGLGLAIAKKVMEAHGGVLDVESRVGEGSTFFFAVPIDGAPDPGGEGGARADEGRRSADR